MIIVDDFFGDERYYFPFLYFYQYIEILSIISLLCDDFSAKHQNFASLYIMRFEFSNCINFNEYEIYIYPSM